MNITPEQYAELKDLLGGVVDMVAMKPTHSWFQRRRQLLEALRLAEKTPTYPISHGTHIIQWGDETFVWYDEAGLHGGLAYTIEDADRDCREYFKRLDTPKLDLRDKLTKLRSRVDDETPAWGARIHQYSIVQEGHDLVHKVELDIGVAYLTITLPDHFIASHVVRHGMWYYVDANGNADVMTDHRKCEAWVLWDDDAFLMDKFLDVANGDIVRAARIVAVQAGRGPHDDDYDICLKNDEGKGSWIGVEYNWKQQHEPKDGKWLVKIPGLKRELYVETDEQFKARYVMQPSVPVV